MLLHMDSEFDNNQVRRTVVFVKKKNGSNVDMHSNNSGVQSSTPGHIISSPLKQAQFSDRSGSLEQLILKNISTPKRISCAKIGLLAIPSLANLAAQKQNIPRIYYKYTKYRSKSFKNYQFLVNQEGKSLNLYKTFCSKFLSPVGNSAKISEPIKVQQFNFPMRNHLLKSRNEVIRSRNGKAMKESIFGASYNAIYQRKKEKLEFVKKLVYGDKTQYHIKLIA